MPLPSASPSRVSPAEFRQKLARVEPSRRDDWVDQWFGLNEIPPDGSDLPRGCVPYLPCAVDKLSLVIERARVCADDLFVDVGSGLGRAMMLVHLLTGAAAVGLEVQAALAREATRIARGLQLERVQTLHGDAEELIADVGTASVFFFYCPFGGDRLLRVMQAIEPFAHSRPLRLCFVDMPAPELPWLIAERPRGDDSVAICWTRPAKVDRAV